MKLRITSDGSIHGTRIEEADSGRELKGVSRVRFEHRAADVPRIEIDLFGTPINAGVAEARYYLSNVGYIRAVELEDGTRVEVPVRGELTSPRP